MEDHRRRNPTEIKYSILKASLGGQRKTRVMYQASLNLAQLNQYLGELQSGDLIAHHVETKAYATTDKGRSFIALFDEFQETSKRLEEKRRVLEGMLTSREKKPLEVPASTHAPVSG